MHRRMQEVGVAVRARLWYVVPHWFTNSFVHRFFPSSVSTSVGAGPVPSKSLVHALRFTVKILWYTPESRIRLQISSSLLMAVSALTFSFYRFRFPVPSLYFLNVKFRAGKYQHYRFSRPC
jgi:hypothetical protein